MTRILATLALLLAFAGIADAACFTVRHVKAVEVQAVAAQVVLPSYYPVQGQPQQQNEDVIRKLIEVLERLEAKLDGGPSALTLESMVKTTCASCHTEGKNPQKGFALLAQDGTLMPLSLTDQKLVRVHVQSNEPGIRMPPNGMGEVKKRAFIEALRQ